MQRNHNKTLPDFSYMPAMSGLTQPSLTALNAGQKGYTVTKAKHFQQFQRRINEQLLQHRIITDNTYTHWFAEGTQNLAQIKAFIIQFSVFSNQFLIAQLNKMIHADSLENMRASKEILANEIGVRFKSKDTVSDQDGLGAIEGSIDGSTFLFNAGHFEWLYHIAEKLDLDFSEIGQPKHGNQSTLFFCNELIRLYGGDNYQASQAASYAVENWAAAGFWSELITGLQKFNARTGLNIPLGFFVWHDKLEAQHAAHTQEELEELYFTQQLDEAILSAHM